MKRYKTTPEFEKDFKRFLKKFRTLKEDLENAKIRAIELFHEKKINNNSVFELIGYSSKSEAAFKLKKFACKSIKGKGVNSGFRIIYVYNKSEATVTFIEMYFKAEQVDADYNSLKKYFRN